MSTPVDFREHVADCLRMAEQAKTRKHKALLLDLAQAWVLLAEQANHLGTAKALKTSDIATVTN